MDLNVGSENPESIQPVVESVETVEVVSGSENVMSPSEGETTSKPIAAAQLSVPSSGMIEIDPHALTCTLVEMANQQLAQGNTILSSSLAAGIPGSVMNVGGSSPLVAGMKRPIMSDSFRVGVGDVSDDIPRKKSRNYLDSHKTIEKKRRDRINTGLGVLKEMVPDCRQYGTKKLDKAEIIEFTIEYIKRMQSQNNGRTGNLDLTTSQREWANDVMTWVFQNKLLYTGSNALEQFCNALLLHLQSFGNPPSSLNSPSNVLLNQGVGGTSSDEETLLRGQPNFLQQLVSASSGQQTGSESSTTTPSNKLEGSTGNSSTNHQQQIAQIQALLLLQQQQLLGQQGGQQHASEGGGANNGTSHDENHAHQLQQLHQLQTLLLQHITSEAGQQKQSGSSEQDMSVALSQSSSTDTPSTVSNNDALMVDPNITDTTITSAVELSLSSAITSGGEGLGHTPIYSSTSLEENLLVSTGPVQENSQMWSDHHQDSPLLLDSSVSVPEHSIENEAVQEEVELLSSQQDH